MHLKALILLLPLAIVLVTSADDYYCDGESAVDNVDYGQLIGNQWYALYSQNPLYLVLCTSFKVDHVTNDTNNLIVTIYFEISGVQHKFVTTYLQHVGPGKYKLWYTDDPGFNPSKPGLVLGFGQMTFTKFLKVPDVNLDVIIVKSCFRILNILPFNSEYVAISGTNLSHATFKKIQSELQSTGINITENPCIFNQN